MQIKDELAYLVKECTYMTVEITETIKSSIDLDTNVILEKNNAIKNLLEELKNVVFQLSV